MAEPRAFGWRPSPPDFRDHLFSVPRSIQEALPPVIDLTSPEVPAPFTPVFQQGSLGSCGPQSAVADLIFAALRQQNLPSVPMPSRLFVYYCTRELMGTIDSDSGVDNRSLLKALARFGWCDETLWPYSDRNTGAKSDPFRKRPSDACYEQAATRKIVQYLSVPQTLTQMKGCLASGDPLIFGFTVYESMMSDGVEHTGIIPMPRPSEAAVGGHDVILCGYNDATRRFKLRNSWGREWGQSGHGEIPYEYATNPQMAGDFWTVRHSAIPTPDPVPPSPPPTPPIPPVPPTPTPIGGRIRFDADLAKQHVDFRYPAGWTGTATKE